MEMQGAAWPAFVAAARCVIERVALYNAWRYDPSVKFANAATEDLYNGLLTKASRKLIPVSLIALARRKLTLVAAAASLEFLRVPPGNHLESLSGDREGQYSIRINEKYRICFTFDAGETANIEITDYH
jgi:proteic killer suppression protein